MSLRNANKMWSGRWGCDLLLFPNEVVFKRKFNT